MSQITVNGRTKLYGIVGNPVDHSFSPLMHSVAFQKIGYNAVYLPFPIEENRLGRLLEAFRLIGVLGFNVTIPFKEKIVPYLDRLSPAANTLQSVNTVVRVDDLWVGDSTDGSGFVRSLEETNVEITDQSVLLIGAGGSARAIAYALAEKKIKRLQIVNRTKEKAEAMKNMLGSSYPRIQVNISQEIRESFDILINCTSVGTKEGASPVSEEEMCRCRQIIDIIYNPLQTTLLKKAGKKGLSWQNGLGMLLYQGVEAFEIWTGRHAPVDTMKNILFNSFD